MTALKNAVKRRNRMAPGPREQGRSGGFTLIELMVALAIGVLLMVVAVPSFVQVRRNADLSAAVSSFVMATTAARSAALKAGRDTYLVPTNPTLGWSGGWYVYVDDNFNGALDTTEPKFAEHAALTSDITVTTPVASSASVTSTLRLTPGYLLYSGSGFPRQLSGQLAAGIIVMATTDRSSTVIIDTTGRVRSCKTTDAGCTL